MSDNLNFNILEDTLSFTLAESAISVDIVEETIDVINNDVTIQPVTVEDVFIISASNECLDFDITEDVLVFNNSEILVVTKVYNLGDGEEMPYAKRVDFENDDTIIYKGDAPVGSAETVALWRIQRITINAEGDATTEWAGGTDQFIHKWSDHLTLEYI